MDQPVSLSFYTTILDESVEIAQSTLKACMEQRLGGPNNNLQAHSFDAKQLKYLGKRAKFEPLQDTEVKDEPDTKRPKVDQRPKDWIDVENKVVVMCVNEEPDCNVWYALTTEQLNAELKPIAERFPNPECNGNMIEYLQMADFTGDETKPVAKQKQRDAMAALLGRWERTYILPEAKVDSCGRLRQLWKPLCVVSIDLI